MFRASRLHSILLLASILAVPPAAHAFCIDDADCPTGMICNNAICEDPNVTPICSEICMADTPCTEPCDNGPTNTTCGSYGVCSSPPPPSCTPDTCTSCAAPAIGVDADSDGVPDRLEHDLAYKYFPDLWLQNFPDLTESYVYNYKAIPYTIRPISPYGTLCNETLECLEIRYGTAYFNDRGDPTWGSGHNGDSEMYAALVMRTTAWPFASGNADNWQMIRDFTAAHWRSSAESSMYGEYGWCPPAICNIYDNNEEGCRSLTRCIWFRGACIGGMDAYNYSCASHFDEGDCFFAGGSCQWIDSSCDVSSVHRCYSVSPRTVPWTTYASEGKHALYHTDAECDGGGICIPLLGCSDECPGSAFNMRNYIAGKLQNVGNVENHLSFDVDIQGPTGGCATYLVWSDLLFGAASSYYDNFTYPLIWDLP